MTLMFDPNIENVIRCDLLKWPDVQLQLQVHVCF